MATHSVVSRPGWCLVAVVVAGAAGVAVPAPAEAAAAGPCPSLTSGVTVVVDFRALGGGIVVRCAPGNPASGLDALRGAGFSTAGTVRWGPTFVCRINGKPTNPPEPCVITPPTDASWAYWHAARGGSWSYSSVAATAFDPPVGSVEGWAFGDVPRPGIAPPARPAAPPPPPPPPVATRPPGPRPPAPSPSATRPLSTAPASASSPTAVVPTPSPSLEISDVEAPLAEGVPPRRRSGVGGLLIGIALIGLTAMAAWWVTRRRRART